MAAMRPCIAYNQESSQVSVSDKYFSELVRNAGDRERTAVICLMVGKLGSHAKVLDYPFLDA
jgi:hypothetical protein